MPPCLSSRSFAASCRPGPVTGCPPCGMASDQAGSPFIPRELKADSPSCPSSSKGWPCREPVPSPKASSQGWSCQQGGVDTGQAAADASRTTWELADAVTFPSTEPVPGIGLTACLASGGTSGSPDRGPGF